MALMTRGRKLNEHIPTSSMADIAFLLLVFFLVTTVFPKDRGLALTLPQEEGEVHPENVLFLHVTGDGFVDVMQGEGPRTFTIPIEGLAALWRERVAERPGLVAALKTSRDAPYGSMIDVLDVLQGVGATRISLQTDAR